MTEWVPRLQFPELLLLAIPLWFVYRRTGAVGGTTGGLRIALMIVLLLCLTGPSFRLGGQGMDVIAVVDRSRSMPDGSERRIRDLLKSLENARGTGDRLGTVTFGTKAHVEQIPSRSVELSGYQQEVLPDGSDLSDGLLTALTLVNPQRPTRFLLLTDGEFNGASPDAAARQARLAGVPVDYRIFERLRVGDVALTDVQLPETVAPLERFQFQVVIDSDREANARVRVSRNEQELSVAETRLRSGRNTVVFRDVHDVPGFVKYTAELEVTDDPVSANNRGEGGLRVVGAPRILLLNEDGIGGNLAAALRAGDLDVDVEVAARHPLTQDSLDPYRTVILENVPARSLGRLKMDRLAQFVEDLGGGLLLTGGRASFGSGGYYESPLDPVLPVSLELRDDYRKTRIALAIALDRSGSMGQLASNSQTKMDLANLGTGACIQLLSRGDQVAVIAVDVAASVELPLTEVTQSEVLAQQVADIEIGGGGIYIYEALAAAGQELLKADQETRHVILFADASDSKQPREYQRLLEQFRQEGISVSVIGLGRDTDSDAQLLIDIAQRGEGNILFTDDAQELPRLFSEDTMAVARSSFIEADPEKQPDGIPGELVSQIFLLGAFESSEFPAVGGYNLTSLRPKASLAAITQDGLNAPLSAFWYRGLGRVAAVTFEADGAQTGPVLGWSSYADFFVTHARWLMGTQTSPEFHVAARKEGQEAIISIELNPEQTVLATRIPDLFIIPPGLERQERRKVDFQWIGAQTLEGRFRLETNGTWRTLLQTGDQEFRSGPAVSLPYSPEFFPRRDLPTGSETLEQLAQISGGRLRSSVVEVFRDPPATVHAVPMIPFLLALAVMLLLLEIAGRRWALWRSVATSQSAIAVTGTEDSVAGWLPRWQMGRRRRALQRQASQRRKELEASSLPSSEPEGPGTDVIFEQAKKRARRRLSDSR